MKIKDLRNDLLNVYKQLGDKKITIPMAKEKCNIAGKIINSAKLELDYNAFLKNKNTIDFLEND